jgi:hypothetical protein
MSESNWKCCEWRRVGSQKGDVREGGWKIERQWFVVSFVKLEMDEFRRNRRKRAIKEFVKVEESNAGRREVNNSTPYNSNPIWIVLSESEWNCGMTE